MRRINDVEMPAYVKIIGVVLSIGFIIGMIYYAVDRKKKNDEEKTEEARKTLEAVKLAAANKEEEETI